MVKTLLLLSGGADSALCLQRYRPAAAIGFDYGQPHVIELTFAKVLADRASVPFEVVKLPVLAFYDDVTFAGRNAVFLTVAAAIAHAAGYNALMIGCNATDASRFPDCRPEFIRAMSDALEMAYGITVMAPLITVAKAEIMAELAPSAATWSCYRPVQDRPGMPPRPCGQCLACTLRGVP